MNDKGYKQYTIQARTCIKGEAFFESLVSDYSVPHHISGPKDLGLDYICEWVYGDEPTGILYAVQVKTYTVTRRTSPQRTGVERKLNGLEKYRICNRNLTIKDQTLRYWKGFGLPTYLFVVVRTPAEKQGEDRLDCYYRRFTTVLTLDQPQEQLDFYKVNEGTRFLAFANEDRKIQGFARDLFIDLLRWTYYKGSITYPNPHKLGLEQFPTDGVFRDILCNYREQICVSYSKIRQFLKRYGSQLGLDQASLEE
jgi:hypothetical protein